MSRPPITAETLSKKCPPLLREFLALYNYNYHAAAKAIGVTGSTVGGWARAEKTPYRASQERMRLIIEDHKKGTSPLSQETATPPEKRSAPDDLVQLIHAVGNPSRVIEMLDVEPAEFYAVYDGAEMSPEMQKKVTSALNSKERIEKARRKKGQPRMSVLPPLIAELITKHHGSVSAASNAVGYKSTTWIMKFADPKEAFTPDDQERVRAAIAEEPMQQTINGLDKGDLGLAIVFCDPEKLSAVFDAGEAMGGEWVFRKRTGTRWLAICRMGHKDRLQAFKAVVRLVADEVITP